MYKPSESSGLAVGSGRANLKPWKPGQSGNPTGQPAWLRKAKKALGKHAERAAEVLAEVLEHGEPMERIRAADVILRYSVPKPTTEVEIAVGPKLPTIDPE